MTPQYVKKSAVGMHSKGDEDSTKTVGKEAARNLLADATICERIRYTVKDVWILKSYN